MNRNQKIALGCGGGGCLALILLVVVCVVLAAAGYITIPGVSSNRNYNYNSNSNTNYNSNLNENKNTDSSTSSSLSDDDKHKLFQAVGMTGDTELIQRVIRKLGFIDESGAATDAYQEFIKEHSNWAMKNVKFIRSVSTPEKAREYVEAHIDDAS